MRNVRVQSNIYGIFNNYDQYTLDIDICSIEKKKTKQNKIQVNKMFFFYKNYSNITFFQLFPISNLDSIIFWLKQVKSVV